MKFEIGKQYVVELGSKHGHSRIIAIYKGEEPNAGLPDCHTVEMVEAIKWNSIPTTLQLNAKWIKESGHGINYIVGGDQILKEVK